MEDLSDKGSESEVVNTKSPNGGVSSEESHTKTCADCGTSKTPLWRGGPAGPKSLCNACGIRSRKKRRAALGLNKEDKKPKKISFCRSNKIGDNMKQRLMMALGREVLMQRKKLGEEEQAAVLMQRKTLGEEEQAAVLLMALSSDSVYA